MADRLDDPLPTGHPERRVPISDLALSLIRTWVPVAVAAGLTWVATRWGIGLPDDIAADVAVWAVAGVTALYYGLARRLESVRGSGLGARAVRAVGRWMLGGVVGIPSYQSSRLRR